MLTNRIASVRTVAREIRQLEEAQDEAIVRAATLAIGMIAARRECGTAANVGHTTLAKVAEIISNSVEVRGLSISAHQELLDLRHSVDLPAQAWGDTCQELSMVPAEMMPKLRVAS